MSKKRVSAAPSAVASGIDIRLQIMHDLEEVSSAFDLPHRHIEGKDAAGRPYPRRERAASVAARPPFNT